MMRGAISPEEFQERQARDGTDEVQQSKVGAQLSDTTTRRVIAIVLLMLCFIPLLGVTNTNRAPVLLTASLQRLHQDRDAWNVLAALDDIRTSFDVVEPQAVGAASQPSLVYLELFPGYPELEPYGCQNATRTWLAPQVNEENGIASVCVRHDEWVGGGALESPSAVRHANDIGKAPSAVLRPSEVLGEQGRPGEGVHFSSNCCLKRRASGNGARQGTCAAWGTCYLRYKFNMKLEAMDGALLSVLTTLFVALMLVVGAHTFTMDAERLVLTPIQEMMDLVSRVSEDPSRPVEVGAGGDGGGQYETRQIENAIKKITDLLRIGFGVAGSEIIRDNLSSTSTSGECIDLMGNPGKRIYSVFGFCMIEDFDHMTDKLGDGIMDFINDVASVVHENVSAWGGQCNKNLGGSFLMTWKVPEVYTRGSTSVDVSRIPYIAKVADRALVGFLKVIADLNRDEKILAYRDREDLRTVNELTGETLPFRVRMGFGLHIGWAIEGPVGSLQKVDATYLSPHVNMAARCETAAKQWHVPASNTHTAAMIVTER